MFCRLSFSVLVLALIAMMSHFGAISAMPMGLGRTNVWDVLAVGTGHPAPGTFMPGDQLASSRENFQNAASNSDANTDTNSSSGADANPNDDNGTTTTTTAPPSPEDNTNGEPASDSNAGETGDSAAPPSSSSAPDSPSSSPPPSTKTNAALPGSVPMVLFPLTITLLFSFGGLGWF